MIYGQCLPEFPWCTGQLSSALMADVLCVAGDQPGAHTGAAHRGLDRGRGPGHRQPPGQPRPAGADPRQVSGML